MPFRSIVRRGSVLATVCLGSCVFDHEKRATADVGLAVASAHVFRGQIMTDEPVVQPALAVNLPNRLGGTTSFAGFGNLDLTDDTGRAWFDDDHAGEFTQVDLSLRHTIRLGPADLTAGVLQYTWPNGEQFPFGAFPNTAEAFVTIGGEVLGVRPAVTAHYDIDEVESLYARGDVGYSLQLSRNWRIDLLAWLGWSDEDHSSWLYRTASSGLADAGLEARVAATLDPVTTLQLAVTGSTIVDEALRDWFAPRVEADNVWFSTAIGWRF